MKGESIIWFDLAGGTIDNDWRDKKIYARILTVPRKRKIITQLVEFFVIGLAMGVTEDLLAIHFATDAKITPHVFKVAFLVALPFAVISELVVDFGFFKRLIFKNFKNHKKRKRA